MLEQTREIVRAFNRTYNTDVLVECEAVLSDNAASLRLPGTDGNEKMSKSIGNCIYLADEAEVVRKKVNDIVTFPRQLSEPGVLEGNVLFIYLDAFCQDEDFAKYYPEFRNLEELKTAYAQGGIGDRRVKDFLYEILNAELTPIRERRAKWVGRRDEMMNILRDGTERANKVAEQTLTEMKKAMGLDYFNE